MPHKTRSQVEAAICAEMDRQSVRHAHRNLRYRVRMKSGKVASYRPAVAVQHGPLLFLVEPVLTVARSCAVERATRFLDQHSPEIVYAVVAPKAVAAKLPPESYDEVYGADDIPKLVRRIKEQDPLGPVRPFAKRR